MDNISYFKLQSKNLFHDFKQDFMQDDAEYVCTPKFFDVNAVVSDFDFDCDNFTLMKAQHIISKMVGFNSWEELIKSSDLVLEQKKIVLENIGYKLQRQKVYNINLSGYEKIDQGKAGDYVIKCPRLSEFEEIISLKPNCYFMSCTNVNLDEISQDNDHIYVNVVPKTSSIRVFIPGAKFPDWYAVSVKNI